MRKTTIWLLRQRNSADKLACERAGPTCKRQVSFRRHVMLDPELDLLDASWLRYRKEKAVRVDLLDIRLVGSTHQKPYRVSFEGRAMHLDESSSND